jgi:hypothetical protein
MWNLHRRQVEEAEVVVAVPHVVVETMAAVEKN